MKAIYSIIQSNYIRFMRYSFVGLVNTAIDLGVFSLMYMLLGYGALTSHMIGFSVAVINSFAWNSAWTFKKFGNPLKFFVAAVVMLAVSTFALWVLKAYMHALVAKILVTGLTVIVGYFVNVRWVYGKS